jgi:CDP-diglyceride synthetase
VFRFQRPHPCDEISKKKTQRDVLFGVHDLIVVVVVVTCWQWLLLLAACKQLFVKNVHLSMSSLYVVIYLMSVVVACVVGFPSQTKEKRESIPI